MSDKVKYSEVWVRENVPEATAELNRLSKKRSVPHTNRYFAVLDRVWFHLKEEWTERFFNNRHRMRKWLMVQCGYSKVTHQKPAGEAAEEVEAKVGEPISERLKKAIEDVVFESMQRAAGQTDDVFMLRDKEGTISYVKADSQKFNRQAHKDFYECEKAMNDKIQYWFDIDVDEMLANDEGGP